METEFVDKSLEELIEEKRREQSGGGGKAPRGKDTQVPWPKAFLSVTSKSSNAHASQFLLGPAGPERGRGGEGVGRGRGGPRGDFPRQVPGAGPIHPYGHPRGGFPMMNPMMNPMMMGAFAGQGGGMFQPPPPSFPNRPGGGRNMGMGGGPPAHQQHPRGGQAPAGNNRDPIFIEAEKKIKTQKVRPPSSFYLGSLLPCAWSVVRKATTGLLPASSPPACTVPEMRPRRGHGRRDRAL